MFLVIEGCDGAGKTTLAESMAALAERRGYDTEIWHSGPPENHPLEEYELRLETSYDPADNKLIIADRWHLGELIYGPLYRPETSASEFSRGAAWHVGAKLNALGAVQVVLNPSLFIIESRLKRRGEDFLRPEHVRHVQSSYSQFRFTDTALGRFVTYISGDVNGTRGENIMMMLEMRRWQGLALRQFPSYVGSHLPSVLLLTSGRGDGDYDHFHHDAALVPYPETNGRWLCDAIEASPVDDARSYDIHNFGIANSDLEDVRALWVALGRPMVVTLDEDAVYTASKFDVPFGVAPGISFARRFHVEPQRYLEVILEAGSTNRKVGL